MVTLLPLCWIILQAFAMPVQDAVPAIAPTVEGSILTSTDNGNTWQDLSNGLPADLTVFSFCPDRDVLYIGTPGGLYKSNTHLPMRKWQKDFSAPKDIMNIFPGKEGSYITGYMNGLSQYQPSTGQWIPMHTTLAEKMVYAVLETTSGVLLAGGETGIYRSTDHGKSWEHVLAYGVVSKLIEAEGVLFSCGNRGLWRSTDGGREWSKSMTNIETPFQIQHLSDGFVTILRGQELGGIQMANMVYKSTDKGMNWNLLNPSLPRELSDIYDLAQTGSYLFACTNKGIFRSDDRGETWNLVLRVPERKGGFFKLVISDQTLYSLFIDGC